MTREDIERVLSGGDWHRIEDFVEAGTKRQTAYVILGHMVLCGTVDRRYDSARRAEYRLHREAYT